jgi:hypothetical protein
MPPAKPGDHPDFFRFPAPPGQSRESSIVLDAQGRFWHDGALVEHPGMARAFAGWIGRHPDNGRFILSNGFDWTYFSVRDVPYFVRSLRAVLGVPFAELSDGSEEPLDPGSLTTGADGGVYCRVKAGRFEAKFTPSAQIALGPWLFEGEAGAVELQLGERRFGVGLRSVQDSAIGSH